jgi:hypothetical protein
MHCDVNLLILNEHILAAFYRAFIRLENGGVPGQHRRNGIRNS